MKKNYLNPALKIVNLESETLNVIATSDGNEVDFDEGDGDPGARRRNSIWSDDEN